jgi:dTDP-4-dehydrorhamnose reductase
MKILVTGSAGQLGTELHDVLETRCPGVTEYVDIDQLDLCDGDAVEKFVLNGGFTHIINCAAYTAVDRAEEETGRCTAVNVDAVRHLAHAAAEVGTKMLHISTDYVFDGTANRPYLESDKPAPTSHYGVTKRKSETDLVGLLPDAIIVRTGWLYSPHSHNFVKTILKKTSEVDQLNVVTDQIGTPTYAHDLAEMIATMVLAPQWLSGTYHFSNEGVASWYDFAVAILEIAGINNVSVRPLLTSDYPTPATRPYYSVLDKSKIKATYNIKLPYWRESLKACIKRLQQNENK